MIDSAERLCVRRRKERNYWFGLLGVLVVWLPPPPITPPAASPPTVPPTMIAPPTNRPVVLPAIAPAPAAAAAAAVAAPAAPAAPISVGASGTKPHATKVLWPAGTCTD